MKHDVVVVTISLPWEEQLETVFQTHAANLIKLEEKWQPISNQSRMQITASSP